jgi:hypothetical protein
MASELLVTSGTLHGVITQNMNVSGSIVYVLNILIHYTSAST